MSVKSGRGLESNNKNFNVGDERSGMQVAATNAAPERRGDGDEALSHGAFSRIFVASSMFTRCGANSISTLDHKERMKHRCCLSGTNRVL
jgi:hypothetical protein